MEMRDEITAHGTEGQHEQRAKAQRSPDVWSLGSPSTPLAPVQFQRSVDTILLANGSEANQRHEKEDANRYTGGQSHQSKHVQSPRRAHSSSGDVKRGDRRLQDAQAVDPMNQLNLFTHGGISIDEHLNSASMARIEAAAFPSPPPSTADDSPMLSPVEAVGELPVLKDRDHRYTGTGHSSRTRASSSAVEFGGDLEASPMPGVTSPKDRTMSETRRPLAGRTQSTPAFRRKGSSTKTGSSSAVPADKSGYSRPLKDLPAPLKMDRTSSTSRSRHDGPLPSPIPDVMPMPPLSMPAFLQLELSSGRPPPLFMHRPSTTEQYFEPTSLKAERLLNFLILPPQLERVLWFGVFACVDAWLYDFTILPLRFSSAVIKLCRSLLLNLRSEAHFLAGFVPLGLSRLWQRQLYAQSEPPTPAPENDASSSGFTRDAAGQFPFPKGGLKSPPLLSRAGKNKRRRRSMSVASSLVSAEKADILKGCLIIASTVILMRFDASMMYHSIRGQAAIKLYVIYNVLEVFDRLLSAIGQDILECLFAPETLSRHANGRSKILRPLSLFPIALIYVLIHATALYYQVITLNVAVNSYSNALLTLLMSNQFVEIKSTVFKRIEKENLFQMTCADVVERFQLWLMLMIIASRNIIETSAASATSSATTSTPPPTTPTLLPFIFTIFPSVSFSQILNPFILVLGTETIVDWIKHAYITKFNNVKPNLYGRFLDVLAKDYYGNAFAAPTLTKRIGLPVIPLTCLAIRAAVQTYHMFCEHLVPAPLASMVQNDALASPAISPSTAAVLQHIDSLFLKVVGNAATAATSNSSRTLPSTLITRYLPSRVSSLISSIPVPSSETLLSWGSTALVLALIYLILLAAKIVLGMLLLSYARNRYMGMKKREHQSTYQEGRRVGGWGAAELDEDKRRWIYADDPERARKLRERDRVAREKEMGAAKQGGDGKEAGGGPKAPSYEGVERYKLGGSKRIW